MRFHSASGDANDLAGTLSTNLAPDGSLWLPDSFPQFQIDSSWDGLTLAEVAARLLAPYFDESPWAKELPAICAEALTFPVPVVELSPTLGVLELFHGPTLAFKDVGARFLAALHRRIPAQKEKLVLVATSGDTGGAVAAAFHKQASTQVAILFPEGKISARQEKQLTAWGDNVHAYAVAGDFDDCQRMAKTALKDPRLAERYQLVSANSISLGRILPQQVYYAATAIARSRAGKVSNFVIPTGNLGNAVAAFWAREMGFPLGKIALATNANRTLENLWSTGEYRPRPTASTLANAMDVGAPSNWERLSALTEGGRDLKREVAEILSVSDDEIEKEIGRTFAEFRYAACPHTATALHVARKLMDISGDGWIAVGTASPVKFETIVEPILGEPLPVPQSLADLLTKPSRATTLSTETSALLKELLK